MSWFNASQLSTFAKQALSQAQKSIDRVLDIQGEEEEEGEGGPAGAAPSRVGEAGKGSLTSGRWDTSTWGTNTNVETQSQPISSPAAITKPVQRTVVDESESFFSAFLPPTGVQSIQQSPVVSKPPAKSQHPKEEIKSTLQEPLHIDLPETETKDFSVELKSFNDDQESLEETNSEQFNLTNSYDGNNSTSPCQEASQNVTVAESTSVVKSDSRSDSSGHENDISPQALPADTKNSSLDTKERKSEDRQSNTPSPPISTFSSGTSTTSDIEVLDHESVISESSASSRQEGADSKASLHLMQTSFQLLTASACTEYNRLEDFNKLTESCCSSDAFERIDSFSVQSLDSRSISEINSDDELSGRGGVSTSIAVNSPTPKCDETEPLKSMSDEIVTESLVVPMEEMEMEESGRSATPVNSEQPDILAISAQTDEEQSQKEGKVVLQFSNEKMSTVQCEKQELCKIIDSLTEKLEVREARLLSVSKEKAHLEETCDNLKDEIFKMKEENSSISSLKEEFAQRIADAEKKVQLACKERDTAKKEIKVLKEDLATRLNSNETAELLKEKDEQIKELLEEGEKLSKQQLQNSNIIKKLRAKEKERENTNTKQNKKIKELEEELQHLKQMPKQKKKSKMKPRALSSSDEEQEIETLSRFQPLATATQLEQEAVGEGMEGDKTEAVFEDNELRLRSVTFSSDFPSSEKVLPEPSEFVTLGAKFSQTAEHNSSHTQRETIYYSPRTLELTLDELAMKSYREHVKYYENELSQFKRDLFMLEQDNTEPRDLRLYKSAILSSSSEPKTHPLVDSVSGQLKQRAVHTSHESLPDQVTCKPATQSFLVTGLPEAKGAAPSAGESNLLQEAERERSLDEHYELLQQMLANVSFARSNVQAEMPQVSPQTPSPTLPGGAGVFLDGTQSRSMQQRQAQAQMAAGIQHIPYVPQPQMPAYVPQPQVQTGPAPGPPPMAQPRPFLGPQQAQQIPQAFLPAQPAYQMHALYQAFSVSPLTGESKLKMSGHNYKAWVSEITLLLLREGTHCMIFNPPAQPWTFAIRDLEIRARTTLLMSMDTELQVTFPSNTTARQIWAELENCYRPVSIDSSCLLMSELHGSRLKPGEQIGGHLTKLKGLRTELRERGHNIEDIQMISIIINSLNYEWKDAVTKINQVPIAQRTVDNVCRLLIEEEAFMLATPHLRGPPASRAPARRPFRGRTYTPEMPRCNTCNHVGHATRDCPQ
ncbi:TATA element modulatory factor isoform X1 [Pantherophis guttatus]|uniref:TATA element modulatory factor isoform X1 n=1 Tax=Pantherophis guttatus TaxID=94885 RepID=A0ABM3YVX8_PANGU|nr:TATA element modulatory factor isoform X1 [Pantherophis guttatus]